MTKDEFVAALVLLGFVGMGLLPHREYAYRKESGPWVSWVDLPGRNNRGKVFEYPVIPHGHAAIDGELHFLFDMTENINEITREQVLPFDEALKRIVAILERNNDKR